MKFETLAQLEVLMQVQDATCGICRTEIPQGLRGRDRRRHPLRATVDHVIPQGMGGEDQWGNRVAAHSRCNNEKGSRWPTPEELEFLEQVNSRIPHLLRLAA